MHLPASVGGVSPPIEPLEALKLYSSLGMRCFPATYGGKTPDARVGKWGGLPVMRPHMWDKLVADWGRFNVALCCEEHLVVIDLDNLDFVAWFDAQGPERLGTWIVRSPSGGLHVYAYSDDPQRTTVIKSDSGVKIGDVKARGGYVIAPPSVGANGDYQTEYGSPRAIARQANALTWFQGYVQGWEQTQPVRLQPIMNDAPEYANGDIHGAPPDVRQDEILGALRTAWMNGSLNRKVYDTLVAGVDAADGYWKNPDDRSEIDFGCVKELLNLGWGFPQIEEAWTFLPVGERYRSNARSHGHGYLLRTFDAAKRKWDAEQIDLQFAVGPGWRVLDGVETWEEGKLQHFSFRLKNDASGTVHALEVDGRAFASPARFKDAMYGQAAFFDLGNFSDAKGLRTLAVAVQRLAVERPKPELATREGHLREQLRVIVYQFALHRTLAPGEGHGDYDAWCDERSVYVLPRRLFVLIQRARMSPAPTEREVWQQWLALGGEQIQQADSYCWRAPRESFPQLS